MYKDCTRSAIWLVRSVNPESQIHALAVCKWNQSLFVVVGEAGMPVYMAYVRM